MDQPSSANDQSFDKSARLLTSKDYSRVFEQVDFKVSTKHFLILARKNDELGARLGIIVAKKHVKLAVGRNRIKRLIRESFRLKSHPLTHLDLIVLAKHGCGELDNTTCQRDFKYLFKKLNKKLES